MAKSYDRNSYRASKKAHKRVVNKVAPVEPISAPGAGIPTNAPGAMPQGARITSSAGRPVGGSVAGGSGAASKNPYSRSAATNAYGKQRKKRKNRKILTGVLVFILVAVLGAAGAAFAYVSHIESSLKQDLDPKLAATLESVKAGDPFYMLLLGTDKSQDRAESAEYAGDTFRTDSIMLLRVDPQQRKVTAVSLMRDTQVDMGANGKQKLNAAYAIGGAPYAVQIVSEMAGVPISHYAEINFDGFEQVVDALGGIDVTVPIEIDDPQAGGYVAAGPQTLNGKEALILCRSRHTYDNIGKGDAYRAANQRMVIAAIVQKILDSDLPTMMSTVSALAGTVTTDLTTNEILTLANSMRGLNTETDFYTAVNPTESKYVDNLWWEIMDENAWKTMMRRIDQGLPPYEEDVVDEATGIVMASSGGGAAAEQAASSGRVIRSGTVSVRNATDINGAGAAAQAKLADMGYTVNTGNANSNDYDTTLVIYETDDQQQYAQEIVDALGVGKAIKNNNVYLFDTNYLVVIGQDWPRS